MKVVMECYWPETAFSEASSDPQTGDEYVYAARAAAQPTTPVNVFKSSSADWPSSKITPCDDTPGIITIHETFIDDLELFHDAVVMNVAPSFPDLSNLSAEKRADVERVVAEFSQLFSTGKDDLGRVNPESKVCHRIDLKPDASPPTRYRAMSSYSQREIDFMEREVQMLFDLQIIKPSLSPWISAPVCVKKDRDTLC